MLRCPSCLQLNMCSFFNKMLRCRVHCNSARRHVKQNVEIPSCMQLSKSSFPYRMLKFKVGKTSFCHQIFRYWVLGTREVVSWMAPLSFRIFVLSKFNVTALFLLLLNSQEKWLHNWISYPSNRSKQILDTHAAYSAGTQYQRQSLNEKQHTWLQRQKLVVCEAKWKCERMYQILILRTLNPVIIPALGSCTSNDNKLTTAKTYFQ